MPVDLLAKYKELVKFIKKESPFTPDMAIILGSGLGNFAESVNTVCSIPTNTIPGYPPSTVQGHSGMIHFAEFADRKLLLFQGRIHFYEGYSLSECILPAFISYVLGCKKLLITNAAGGVKDNLHPGDLMLNTSMNGIAIKKEITELLGLASPESKDHMLNFPSKQFNELARLASKSINIELKEGVYWFSKGPTYETPAEVRMAGKFGADAVGMSTVHEAYYALYSGIDTTAISCITNYAAGISNNKLTHSEVTETASLVKSKFESLVKEIITSI